MAKINLPPITGGFNLSQINSNFDKVEEALNDKVLYRNNPIGEPNQMQNDLDMNGKRLYNLPVPTSNGEPIRLGDRELLVGPKGEKGDTGPQGVQGPRGFQGVQGVQGIQGVAGSVGPVGPQGVDGRGVNILGSYNTLIELEASHPSGSAGDAYMVGAELYVWVSGQGWTGVGNIQGPQGVQGPQGPQGPQGVQGVQGIEGPEGVQGPVGVDTGLGDYTGGLEFVNRTQTVYYSNQIYRIADGVSLPYTTVGTWGVDAPNLRAIQGVTHDELAAVAEANTQTNNNLIDLINNSRKSLYTVQANKTIHDPKGNRFVVNGVTMFDYLLIGHESRVDQRYRSIYNPPWAGPGTGVSEPTYYARWSYINTANVIAQLTKAKGVGVNLVRVAVEPAIMLATTSYVDPSDGLTYPADLTMLDDIIKQAGILGLVVQLQNANDMVPVADNVIFLRQIADRYKAFPWVWINPANELNGGNGSGDVNNIPVWTSTMVQYMDALRQPLPSGGRFLNPVIVNPPYYGNNLNGVVSILNTNPSFRDDPNMLVGIHIYAFAGENDFRTTRLPTEVTQWFQYLDQFCIFIDEVGIDNFAGRYDPNIDPSIPSVNPTAWGQMQNWAGDFLRWSWEQSTLHNMNGLTGFMWYAWIPGLVMHDDNTMLRMDGTWTTWGNIFVGNYSSHPVRRLDMRRSLGADFDTGAWGTGDILDGSITNNKLAAVWNTYTPTVTAATGTITSASASGRWIQIGKVVTFQVYVNIVVNGTGSGNLNVTLPVLADNSYVCSGLQIVNNFTCSSRTTGGSDQLILYKYDGTYPSMDGSQFILTGSYGVF